MTNNGKVCRTPLRRAEQVRVDLPRDYSIVGRAVRASASHSRADVYLTPRSVTWKDAVETPPRNNPGPTRKLQAPTSRHLHRKTSRATASPEPQRHTPMPQPAPSVAHRAPHTTSPRPGRRPAQHTPRHPAAAQPDTWPARLPRRLGRSDPAAPLPRIARVMPTRELHSRMLHPRANPQDLASSPAQRLQSIHRASSTARHGAGAATSPLHGVEGGAAEGAAGRTVRA